MRTGKGVKKPLAVGAPRTFESLRNGRTLVVGRERLPALPDNLIFDGLKTDFRTISEAMSVIPLPPKVKGEVSWPFIGDVWTIFVTPGVYDEEIRMKPNVSIVGLGSNSVLIGPPPDGKTWTSPEGRDGRRAIVYLNHNCSVNNVVLAKNHRMRSRDYVFWNRDRYGLGRKYDDQVKTHFDPSGIGLNNVWIWPFPFGDAAVDGPDGRPTGASGKALLMEGSWHTALFNNFGSTLCEPTGFDVELSCELDHERKPRIVDCHFIGCFFDALFLATDDGGCVRVRDCQDVHIRNSLLRIQKSVHVTLPRVPGSCVRGEGQGHLWLEHSSLEVPGTASDRALSLELLVANEEDAKNAEEARLGFRCANHYSAIASYHGELHQVDLAKWPPDRHTRPFGP
jgi:hypothetical protein